ncbi:hypothetical protein [Vibrio harveyi]|uniref:hypothetical protein n=1 Tax=Vibrio harveyi TaxID=669 RepID=UPI003CF2DEC5
MDNKFLPYALDWATSINTDITGSLGTGDYGCAFKTQHDEVLKITTDKRELYIAHQLIDLKLESFVKIHTIHIFPNGLIGIHQELASLSNELSKAFVDLCWKALRNNTDKFTISQDLLTNMESTVQKFVLKYHDECNLHNLLSSDLHGSNIGLIKDQIVAFDQRAPENDSLDCKVEELYKQYQAKFNVSDDIDSCAHHFRPKYDEEY